MCSGRIDPSLVMDTFLNGADGVFIGACLLGECHYTDGNLHALARVSVTHKVLSFVGVNPERLVVRMMSSAEGAKFVNYTTEFTEAVKKLGPLGGSEGLGGKDLKLKLEVAKNALESKKLRWIIGKSVEFAAQGNLYDEVFTEHELGRMYDEIVIDECTMQEILLRGRESLLSVKELATALDTSPHRILRQLADMRRMGMAEIEQVKDRTPLWRVTAEGRPLSARLLCDAIVGEGAEGSEKLEEGRGSTNQGSGTRT
jgi:coenzyme F420-reducing hydrogenase delta subunit